MWSTWLIVVVLVLFIVAALLIALRAPRTVAGGGRGWWPNLKPRDGKHTQQRRMQQPQQPQPPYDHELPVSEPWLKLIASGAKRVEGRKGSSDKYAKWVGARVKLMNRERTVIVRVAAVRHYPTLADYLDAEGWANVAPHLHSYEETAAAYRQFYSDAKIAAAGGMNAIQVEVVDA
jgi:ASC-1-like (ASCH) protein